MKGLELSRIFFDECVEPMLREKFPELLPYVAVGLTGQGSECYGFDDDISQDHDFEPGVIIFIPDEGVMQAAGADAAQAVSADAATPLIDSRTEFKLTRAYAALPKEILGYKRSLISPVGGARHGVMRMGDYWKRALGVRIPGENYANKTGTISAVPTQDAFAPLTADAWLRVPEYALAEATNGEIFRDDYGAMTNIRKKLRRYPDDIKRKKLAGYLLLMQQSGEYNYPRCLAHGETAAAQLAICEFVKAAMHVVFLLNDRYMPYYKWAFRAMRSLSMLAPLALDFEHLLTTPNNNSSTAGAPDKQALIARIIRDIVTVIELRGLVPSCENRPVQANSHSQLEAGTEATSSQDQFEINLEALAYKMNDTVSDAALRNEHILAGIE